jgi:protocatechuate 3,4-dioxygenase, alpha subunit
MPGLTPSQTVGPYFHFSLTAETAEVTDLVGPKTEGERIKVMGIVRNGAGEPLPDAMIEIWQANAAGRYNHPADTQAKPLDPDFCGFGRCGTNADGQFHFKTIKPGAVPGRGNSLQAPHINFAIFARGLLKQLYTRLYFADEPANENDPVLALVPEARRQTITANRSNGPDGPVYRFDIVLRGEGETVFFDV